MIQEKVGQVTFSKAIRDFFKGYADFRGRTTRAGYWWSILLSSVIIFVEFWITKIYIANNLSAFLLSLLIFLIFLGVPMFALQTRRYRDVGISNIGIVLLVFVPFFLGLFLQGQVGDNLLRSWNGVTIALSCLATNTVSPKSGKKSWFTRKK